MRTFTAITSMTRNSYNLRGALYVVIAMLAAAIPALPHKVQAWAAVALAGATALRAFIDRSSSEVERDVVADPAVAAAPAVLPVYARNGVAIGADPSAAKTIEM